MLLVVIVVRMDMRMWHDEDHGVLSDDPVYVTSVGDDQGEGVSVDSTRIVVRSIVRGSKDGIIRFITGTRHTFCCANSPVLDKEVMLP